MFIIFLLLQPKNTQTQTGIGAGLLRNLYYKSIELNIVCADFVTNGSLAIAWHTYNQYGRTQFEAKVYQINRVSDPTLIFGKMLFFYTPPYLYGLYLIFMVFEVEIIPFVLGVA